MHSVTGWSPQLHLGNDVIDADHMHLFALADTLHAAMVNPEYDENIRVVLDDLLKFSGEHFAREEALMIETQYPNQSDHVFEHRLLTYRLRKFRNRHVGGERGLARELQNFIDGSLTRHIMTTDLRLAQHIKSISSVNASNT